MPPQARKDDVKNWSAAMPDTYLQCRDWGHEWRPHRASWDAKERCYLRVLRCRRCSTERTQFVGRDGSADGSRYAYPEGYAAPSGVGRLDSDLRSTLRLESTLRLVHRYEASGGYAPGGRS